jgi:DNA-directed RNA polymerase specialized sigma24 family protein
MSTDVSRTPTLRLDLEELRLVAAAKAGDKLCYRQLLARNQEAAFRAAYLVAGSFAQARAATLQACIEGWTALRRFPATAPFGPWLVLLAVREADGRDEARLHRLPRRIARADLATAGQLHRRLDAAGAGVRAPPAPDLAGEAVAELPERRGFPLPSTIGRGNGRGGAIACATSAVALLVAAAIVVPRAPRLPAPLERIAAHGTLGRRIPLTRARHGAGFTALLPPAPSAAFVGRDAGATLSLLAGPELITEFRGSTIPYILGLIGPGAHAELTWVNGRPGAYGRSVRANPLGDVLTWLQGPLTLRIEGAQTLEQALALARSLR